MNLEIVGLYVVAGTVGLLVAMTDLLARYRDEPDRAIASRGGVFYLFMHVVISCFAAAVVVPGAWPESEPSALGKKAETTEPKMTVPKPSEESATGLAIPPIDRRLLYALLAGFSGVVVLRSSVRLGPSSSIGPGQVIEAILGYIDRHIDRGRAGARTKLVVSKMRGVDFDLAKLELPMMLSQSMQRLTEEEDRELGEELRSLSNETILSNELKCLALGYLILNLAGEELFATLIEQAGSRIKLKPVPHEAPVTGPAAAAPAAGASPLPATPLP